MDSTRVGAYPKTIIIIDTKGMDIQRFQHLLMGIGQEAPLFGCETHQAAIITGYPDVVLAVITEPRHDISRETVGQGKTLKAFTQR